MIRTFLVGLVGRGIGASRSPQIHESEAARLGVPLVYRLIDFARLGIDDDRLDSVVRAAQVIGFDGLNVTHPFKQRIMPLIDEVSAAARTLGAVNTVCFRGGRRCGSNTDWIGFRDSFLRNLGDAPRRDVAQIGAGGAGAATAYALLDLGVERLTLFDVDRARANDLAERLARLFSDRTIAVAAAACDAIAEANGVVQTSPVGMASHPGVPFDPGLLRSDMWVAEVIYFPAETALLRTARALGCRTLGGGQMAVVQAAAAFEEFTGVTPSVARMLAAFDAAAPTY